MRNASCALAALAFLMLALPARAQDIEPKYKTPDTNNAVIQGRVTLPSGFSAERYVRITLRNDQSILSTLYTNKSGEFHLRNLSEGTYIVQAESTDGEFEPVMKRVALGRGLMVDLNLQLTERKSPLSSHISARVVSAAELRQVVPAAAKKEYELGLKFVNKGDFKQAASHFAEALNLYPDYLAARNDLGAQYLKLNRLDDAESQFQIVLHNDPKNFNAKFNMGLVYVERHNYTAALDELNQAVSIDSTRPVARLWIGIAKLEMGNLPEAEQELTRALIMGADTCVAAHYYLARISISRGDFAEASRFIRIYLEESPRGEFVKQAKELEKQIENARNK